MSELLVVCPAGKDISAIRVVVCGCGAAGFTCAKYFVSLGVQQQNLIAVDVKVSTVVAECSRSAWGYSSTAQFGGIGLQQLNLVCQPGGAAAQPSSAT
jgi:malic enzyme